VSPYTVSMICVLPPVILTLLVLGAVVLGEYIRWDQGRVPPAWELFGVALSPPANLLTLTFFQEDWRGGYDGWIIQEVYNQFRWRLTAASLGLACYVVAALLLWRATCRSFPRVTGRMAERSRQAPARAGQGSGA
jgi:hypothetical protein